MGGFPARNDNLANLPKPARLPTHPPTPPPQLGIHLAEDPVLCAWRGAALLAASPAYPAAAVSRQEWRARGAAALAKWDQ